MCVYHFVVRKKNWILICTAISSKLNKQGSEASGDSAIYTPINAGSGIFERLSGWLTRAHLYIPGLSPEGDKKSISCQNEGAAQVMYKNFITLLTGTRKFRIPTDNWAEMLSRDSADNMILDEGHQKSLKLRVHLKTKNLRKSLGSYKLWAGGFGAGKGSLCYCMMVCGPGNNLQRRSVTRNSFFQCMWRKNFPVMTYSIVNKPKPVAGSRWALPFACQPPAEAHVMTEISQVSIASEIKKWQ